MHLQPAFIYSTHTLCFLHSVSQSCSFHPPFFKCQIKTSSGRYSTIIVTFLELICSQIAPFHCGFSSRHHLGPVFQYLKIIRINWITEKSLTLTLNCQYLSRMQPYWFFVCVCAHDLHIFCFYISSNICHKWHLSKAKAQKQLESRKEERKTAVDFVR